MRFERSSMLGRYIEGLPEAMHDRPEWQTAIHFLLMAPKTDCR